MRFNSPIEQFILIPTWICGGVSNVTLFYVLIFFIFMLIIFNNIFFKKVNTYFFNNLSFIFNTEESLYITKTIYMLYFIPTKVQYLFESLIFEFTNAFKTLLNSSNIFSFFYSIIVAILFILFSNLIGLVPYTFTLTAQIFITLNVSLLIFISFNIMGMYKFSYNLIQLVVPSGVNISLHFLLIPIEIISYIFKPISLSIRLFANIMAGHTLLKVICGFIYKSFKIETYLILNIFPFLIISVLFVLECFVAFIQSYVFFILLCIFLKDIINLSH
jgi:ATP synthase subunit 6